jgi:hypothetical protein
VSFLRFSDFLTLRAALADGLPFRVSRTFVGVLSAVAC